MDSFPNARMEGVHEGETWGPGFVSRTRQLESYSPTPLWWWQVAWINFVFLADSSCASIGSQTLSFQTQLSGQVRSAPCIGLQ